MDYCTDRGAPRLSRLYHQLAGNESGGYLATERGAWGKGWRIHLLQCVSPCWRPAAVEETLAALQQLYDA